VREHGVTPVERPAKPAHRAQGTRTPTAPRSPDGPRTLTHELASSPVRVVRIRLWAIALSRRARHEATAVGRQTYKFVHANHLPEAEAPYVV
jgi:hypothetical protein